LAEFSIWTPVGIYFYSPESTAVFTYIGNYRQVR